MGGFKPDYRESLREVDTAEEQSERIAENIFVSCNTSSNFRTTVGVGPEDTRGKRVLDLGSGLSDFVMRSNEAGGFTVGIDTAYASLEELEERGRSYVGYIGALDDPANVVRNRRTMERALADIRENPQRYIGASTLSLPFPNNTFDIVISNCFLTSSAGSGAEYVEATVLEALRVIQRGGTLNLGPNNIEVRDGVWAKEVESNIRRAFSRAEEEKLAVKFVKYGVDKENVRYVISRSRKR